MKKVILPLLLTSNAFAQNYTIGISADPYAQKSAFYKEGLRYVTQAYKGIGMDFKVKFFKAEHSYKMATRGMIDAEFFRVKGLEKKFPHLVRVPYKLVDFNLYIYSIHKDPNEVTLKNYNNFNIGTPKDYFVIDKAFKGNKFKKSKTLANLVSGLINKKYDYILISNYISPYIDNIQKKYETKIIRRSKKPIVHDEVYHYVNVKHKNIVKKLAESFKSIKVTQENYPHIFSARK